jgi:DNA-binding XRE family transcriptional regulator
MATIDEKTAAEFTELGEGIDALATKIDAEKEAILAEYKGFVDLINEGRRTEDWKLAAKACRALAVVFRERHLEGTGKQYEQRAKDYDDLAKNKRRRLRGLRGGRGRGAR